MVGLMAVSGQMIFLTKTYYHNLSTKYYEYFNKEY